MQEKEMILSIIREYIYGLDSLIGCKKYNLKDVSYQRAAIKWIEKLVLEYSEVCPYELLMSFRNDVGKFSLSSTQKASMYENAVMVVDDILETMYAAGLLEEWEEF